MDLFSNFRSLTCLSHSKIMLQQEQRELIYFSGCFIGKHPIQIDPRDLDISAKMVQVTSKNFK